MWRGFHLKEFFFLLLMIPPRQIHYVIVSFITHLSKMLRRAHRAQTKDKTVSPPRAQDVSPPCAHCQVDNDCLAAARPGCLTTARPFSSSQLRSHDIYYSLRHDDGGTHGASSTTVFIYPI
jgi:hypothetical protein